jgi:hypothetical protein
MLTRRGEWERGRMGDSVFAPVLLPLSPSPILPLYKTLRNDFHISIGVEQQ